MGWPMPRIVVSLSHFETCPSPTMHNTNWALVKAKHLVLLGWQETSETMKINFGQISVPCLSSPPRAAPE